MELNTWLLYLLAAIGLSLSPGPNGLLALTLGALHGRRKALYTIFGGAFGFIIVVACSMLGIGALLKASLVWLTVMKWVGGAYLVWLGIQVWRSPPIGIEVRGPAQPRAGWSLFQQYGSPHQPVAAASWAALQPGLRRGIRGDRGCTAPSRLSRR